MTGATGSVRLGDLVVRRPGLGTMGLTGPGTWGPPRDPAAARALLTRARDLGVDFFDTADSYGPETSEEVVAEALRPYRDVTVATKGGLTRQGPSRWARDARPARLRAACEGSLRRLGVDCIDLYQLHAVDPAVPLEESLGCLAELRAEGKVRHVGVCNVTVEELERALGELPVVSVQNRLGVHDRASLPVVEACERHGLAFVPWGPLGSGTLARSGGALHSSARRLGATPAQLALAWLLQLSPVVVPIPGTRSIAHLEENLGACDVTLDAEALHALAGPVAAEPGVRELAHRVARVARRAARRVLP